MSKKHEFAKQICREQIENYTFTNNPYSSCGFKKHDYVRRTSELEKKIPYRDARDGRSAL